jgi:hypothetical protein
MSGRPDSIGEKLRARIRPYGAWASDRPDAIARRWPSSTWVTRGLLCSIGTAGLAVVLVSVLASGPLSGAGPGTVSPSAAVGYPTATPGNSGESSNAPTAEHSPAADSSLAGTSPTDMPSLPPGTSLARVTARPHCETFTGQGRPTVSGNAIYAICGYDPLADSSAAAGSSPAADYSPITIRSIDATTGKTIATYPITDLPGQIAARLAVDNGLWYSTDLAGACVYPCTPLTRRLARLDLASGQVTFSLDGSILRGDGLGYVWASPDASGGTILTKIDPVTLKTSTIPWNGGEVEIACSSLWSLARSPQGTVITRVDPATGRVLATFTEPGDIRGLQQTPEGCWAIDYLGTKTEASGGTRSYRYVRVGSSSVESRSPIFTLSDLGFSPLSILDGTFWLADERAADEVTVTLRRLDPSTWQPVGTAWVVSRQEEYCAYECVFDFFTAGGAIWLWGEFITTLQLEGGVRQELQDSFVRVDVPLGPLPG